MFWKLLSTACAAGLLLVSCVPATPQTRIARSPEKFQALSGKFQSLVQQGQLARGMSADAVYLAWGPPTRVFQGSQNGRSSHRWDYAAVQPVYVDHFDGGYGYGPYSRYGYSDIGFGMGPEIAYIPYRSASVWFINQRVDSWEQVK